MREGRERERSRPTPHLFPSPRVPSRPTALLFLPLSLTLLAGRLIMALASSASSLSKTGLPSPGGQPRTMQVTSPPHESPRVRTASMAAYIASAAPGSGHRVGWASTSARVTAASSKPSGRPTSRTRETKAMTSVPATVASSFLATAPAATRPIVSRADARPPPATARMPYFMSYVASAWEGR